MTKLKAIAAMYMRALGIEEDTIVFPAGRYHRTEQNLRKNNRIQLLVASIAVPRGAMVIRVEEVKAQL